MQDATLTIPASLASVALSDPKRRSWLARLPRIVARARDTWSLELAEPYDGRDVSAAWVAPARRADGSRTVLKVGMPHMEAEHEAQGLRFWAGDPAVLVLEVDAESGAMLLERCEPGTSLRELAQPDQDVVLGRVLRRLWRAPPASAGFRPLRAMLEYWSAETLRAESDWPDVGLVRAGLQLFEKLSEPTPGDVLLATDLHAGNVLAAQREPWLMIDPKPFVGDRAYDATQHLLNCKGGLLEAPAATIRRFSAALELDAEPIREWLFARAAAEPRERWDHESLQLARLLDATGPI
jgi:streptomycin 6-kinase